MRAFRPQDGDPVSAAAAAREPILSSPAFWAADGDPASRDQRGRKVVTGRAATTLMARAAAIVVRASRPQGAFLHRYGDPSISSGLLGRRWRPSVARSAWSKGRTGKFATTLITRAAAYYRTGRNSHGAFAVDCPARTLCGAAGVAVRIDLHNAMPGTSRWGVFFVSCYGFGSGVSHEQPGVIMLSRARMRRQSQPSGKVVSTLIAELTSSLAALA